MTDLSIDFAGVKFKNPVLIASTTFGWDGKALKKAALAGAGGIVCKTIDSLPEAFQHPRCGRMVLYKYDGVPIGMQNNELFSTINLKDWVNKELKIAAEGDAKMVVSIVANPNPSVTIDLAKKVADTGLVDIFELNVGCPMSVADVEVNIGKQPGLVAEQVRAVKKACPDIPIMPKLSPDLSDVPVIAKACEDSGADAIAATNSILGLVGVDIETGRPLLPAFGGYSGPGVYPIMLRIVAQIAQTVKIPVSGIGGISNWKQAIEMMMVGASTVQIGTAVMWKGYNLIGDIVSGIESFMARKGYKSTKELVGIALKHISTTEEMAKLPQAVSVLNEDLCIGCGDCVKVCAYDAIELNEDNIPKINIDNCDGCGLCVQICQSSALTLVDKIDCDRKRN